MSARQETVERTHLEAGGALARLTRSVEVLGRDPWVRAMLAFYGLLVALYSLPGVPFAWRELLTWYLADPLLLLLALGAIIRRRSEVEGNAETRFWQLLGVGLGFWLLGSITTSWLWLLAPDGMVFPKVAVDVWYIGYYLAVIFAVELQPDRRSELRKLSGDERLNRVAVVAFCLAMLDYFVLIPSYLDRQDYDSLRPSLLLYLGLDLLLCLRFALRARRSAEDFWRLRYLALASAFGISAVLLLLELHSLLPGSPIPAYAGSRWDVLWYLPFVAFSIAARIPADAGARRHVLRLGETEVSRSEVVWGPVLLYALVPPCLHLVLHHQGQVSVRTLAARETLVIVYFLFTGILALLQYRSRETRRREAARALRDSEDRYRQLVEGAPDAILVEREGRVVYANPVARRLLGAERLDRRPSFEALGLPAPSVDAFLAQDRLSPATLAIEHRLRGGDGTWLCFEVAYLWIHYQGAVACQAILHDVTAERRLRDQAEEMEQKAAVGELAGTIAHEIRNPLASLLFNLRLLAPALEENPSNHRRIETIEGAAERMQAIIRGILDFTRGENTQWMEESLGSIVRSALRSTRPALEAAGIEVQTSFEAGDDRVRLDVHQMAWVLGELLTNAGRAMPEGGSLEVGISRLANGALEIVVEDSGPGIDPEHLDRVSQPFFSTWDEGLGLGLARVAQILERHGFTLDIGHGERGGARIGIVVPALRPVLETTARFDEIEREASVRGGSPAASSQGRSW